ncbi:MAG: HDIG domain-containing protein [Phycisphaerales bacterium]|nr:HDIG domain-containing protein [Phycisphaerales bacterium]
MWPFDRMTTRRSEIRRAKAERIGPWYSRLSEVIEPSWAVVAFLSTVVACVILNVGGDQFDLMEGQSTPRAIVARVDFEVPDDQQTREMRIRARDSSPNHYKLDDSLLEDIRGRLGSALTLARTHREDVAKLKAECEKNKLLLDDEAIAAIIDYAAAEDGGEFPKLLDSCMATLRTRALVDPEPVGVRRTATRAILLDAEKAQELQLTVAQLTYTNDIEAVKRLLDDCIRVFPPPLRPSMLSSLAAMLAGEKPQDPVRAIYRFDAERTGRIAQQAYEAVPQQFTRYTDASPLADRGELTEAEIRLLRYEHAAFQQAQLAVGSSAILKNVIGRSVLACLVIFGVVAYLSRHQRHVLTNAWRRLTSTAFLLVIFALVRYGFVAGDLPAHFGIGAQALAAATMTIVYPAGVVFGIGGGLAVLNTVAMQQGVGFFVTLLVTTGVFAFGLRQVRNRGKIVLTGIVAAGLAALTTIAISLIDEQPTRHALTLAAWAGGSTLLAAFVVEGILPGIERLFRLSTGMTLLEWCDANKPLMRMMAAEAPGTYNHSLLVGALAEAAAESIGANGLLARCGAYYHDIGKINKPEYFVENQAHGTISRHERLAPNMSLLIIINHVKDGIEMAREYGLPGALLPFIAEHHGTTLVEYFYKAAKGQRRPGDQEISDSAYRYGGPKPQSRETAILMLADGVEGAVRAMSEPTPGRIEDTVAEIVRKRLADGQFDECDLTFAELADVQRSLVKTLCSIYHARIVYPEADDEKKPPTRSASA